MADPLQQISFGISEIGRSIQESGIFDLIGIVIAILIVCAIGIFVLIGVVKILKRGREFVGATGHIGTMKISIRHQSYITGNVNTNKSFLVADVLERMKEIPQIKKDPVKRQGIIDIEELWREELLYAYDMKVIESFKTELDDDEILLLSPIKIENPDVAWKDEKGDFSISGSPTSMFKRYPTNIQCSELTEHYDIVGLNRKKKRVYVLVPFTDTVNEKLMANPKGKVVKDILRGRQVFINMINLPNKEALSTLAVYIPSLDELYKELEIREQKLRNVEEQRDQNNQLADDLKTEIEGYKARLKTHTMIGYDKPIFPIEPKSLFGIAIGAVVAGFASAKIAGIDIFVRYQGLEYLFLVGAVVVVIASIKLFEKKPKSAFATQDPGAIR